MPKTWNFGMPKAGAVHSPRYDVRTVKGGRQWTATWHVAEGKLYVDSAWGSNVSPAGPAGNRALRAAAILEDLVTKRLATGL